MTPNALTDEARIALLGDLMGLRSDADQLDGARVLRSFLPLPAHARALSRDVMVVRGERGAGKSMLFRALSALEEAGLPITSVFPRADTDGVVWVEGFSERGTEHPTPDLMARFVEGATFEQLRVMWVGHLIGRIAKAVDLPGDGPPQAFMDAWSDPHEITRWAAAADAGLPALTSWLDAAHRALAEEGREVIVLYDSLDKIGTTSVRVREQTVGSLLALWLSLSNRYRSLRAKIFVREDLFDASLSASADASKLRSRSVALTWDQGSLYRLLIRQMAALSPEMHAWIEDTQNYGVPLEERGALGWFPPDGLPEKGRPSQAGFIEHLAGPLMGRGVKKGSVYNWIPNRLRDARGAIVPRSLLNLVGYAAEHARVAPRAKYKRLLTPGELQGALEQTSKQRVAEIGEEHVVVYRIEALRGVVLPVPHAELVKRLSNRSIHEDPFGDDGYEVAMELARIGVLRDRGEGRWDVPDIYRYGYGIKRRGGAPRR